MEFLEKNANYILGFLILLAIVLGVILIKNPGLTSTVKNASSSGTPLTDSQRQAILNFPNASASAEEKNSYSALVRDAAQASNSLTIGAVCIPDPLVMKVKNGATLTIKNVDSNPHTVSVDADHVYQISAEGSTNVTVDFAKSGTPGIAGYKCDNGSLIAGVIYITN